MMQYRRAYVPGGTYFFTVNLLDRKQTLLTDHIDQLKLSLRLVKQTRPFRINAMVVLPDHLHAIWSLPEGDTDFVSRWGVIKSTFSRNLPKTDPPNASRRQKGERAIWQRRYWEHLIRDTNDYARHVDYIHFNPVKHGYVERAVDWPWSSIHRFIREGIIPADWGCADTFDAKNFGEPCTP